MKTSGRLAAWLIAGLMAASATATMAEAQVTDRAVGAGPGGPVSPPPPPAPTEAVDAPPVEHLFGDWGGLQPYLLDRGINLQLEGIGQ